MNGAATSPAPRYDVVIPSAVAGNLIACVRAILAAQPELDPARIVVVDDGARVGAETALPGVRWVDGIKPFIFARNANAGIAACTGDVILLNDDAELLSAGGFDTLARAASSDWDGSARPGAIAAAVRGLVGNPRQKVHSGGGIRSEPRQLCFICVYLPRTTLETIGPLDTRFSGYGFDDDDYCDRIRSAGLTLAIHDGCVVDHSGRLRSTFRHRADFATLSAHNQRLYRRDRMGAKSTHDIREADVTCAMRVKNEAEHIGEVIESVLPFCARILVFDDHSEDKTAMIAAGFGTRVTVIPSPFTGLDEARDKNHLLAAIVAQPPDWLFWIDGDEVLERDGPRRLRAIISDPRAAPVQSLQIAYLWDDPQTVRTDGLFGRFSRPSLFRLTGQALARLHFPTTGPGNLHCGNVPRGIIGAAARTTIRLKHYGYLHAEQRQRKYEWYNRIDPNNRGEDGYRHLIGIPGARHAPGPLVLEPWDG